jgi:hypothetical protein
MARNDSAVAAGAFSARAARMGQAEGRSGRGPERGISDSGTWDCCSKLWTWTGHLTPLATPSPVPVPWKALRLHAARGKSNNPHYGAQNNNN